MFVSQPFAGFHFKEEAIFHKHISEVVTQDRPVLISHPQGFLLLHSQANFSQTVGHPVFVYLLEMPVPEIATQVEGRLADSITQGPNALFVSPRWALFVFFVLFVAT